MKPTLLLKAKLKDTLRGVLSELISEDGLECYILERPELDNLPNYSCIPAGSYIVEPVEAGVSTKFPYAHFEIMNVPGRSKILIHGGNDEDDTSGCLLTGYSTTLDPVGDYIVNKSRNALEYLFAMYGDTGFVLKIDREVRI